MVAFWTEALHNIAFNGFSWLYRIHNRRPLIMPLSLLYSDRCKLMYSDRCKLLGTDANYSPRGSLIRSFFKEFRTVYWYSTGSGVPENPSENKAYKTNEQHGPKGPAEGAIYLPHGCFLMSWFTNNLLDLINNVMNRLCKDVKWALIISSSSRRSHNLGAHSITVFGICTGYVSQFKNNKHH